MKTSVAICSVTSSPVSISGRVVPEAGRLDLLVADDEPLEVGQPEAVHARVGVAHRRVLPTRK